MGLLIRETDSSVLAFALYRRVADREAAVRALKERLALPVVEFTLSTCRKNPVSLLHTVSPEERACIFFYDLEEALPDVAGFVNLQREEFAKVPHAVIFWVREHGLREIAAHAPDFWAWRSGVFDFRLDQFELPLTAVQTALAEPLVFRDRADLERRISLYQGLIREYSQQEKPDESFLARLQVKLGSAFYLLGDFKQAEPCFRQALERTSRVADKRTEAKALHNLGVLAQERWQIDEAEEKYRQSLALLDQVGDDRALAPIFHQLGTIAQEHGNLDEAEEWYRKSLEIKERLGLEREAALTRHQLGRVAQERQKFDLAELWYHKALAVFERLGLERYAALPYHQLGIVAHERQQLDEAEHWYRKALEIFERMGLLGDAARTYHQLGLLAQERRQFDEAEQWYRKALKVFEGVGLKRYVAHDDNQLGNVANLRQHLEEAMQSYRKALEIYESLGDLPSMVNPLAQLGLLYRRQNHLQKAASYLGKAWTIAAEQKMPIADSILKALAKVLNAMGEAEFTAAWRQRFPGQEPPLEAIRELTHVG